MSALEAHLIERWETDDEDHLILAGRFDGDCGGEEVEDVSYDEALRWARARSSKVTVAVGDPEDPQRLAEGADAPVRRRPAGEEWLDRRAVDPPVEWEVVAWLSPHDGDEDEVVGAVVATLEEEAGASAVAVDRDELDAGLAEIERQWEQAGRPDELSWVTGHALAFRVVSVVRASTHRMAAALVRAAAEHAMHEVTRKAPYGPGAEDLEGRWGLEVEAHPPGFGEFRSLPT